MDLGELAHTIFISIYTFALVMVSIYGLHRYAIVFLYYRHRSKAPVAPSTFDPLPHVTLQLPMYNEQYVASRIIEKACLIDYPKDKLQIQVLDDSTDDTVAIASKAVEEARARGFDIEYIHRGDRIGYKAGALANGLKTATGEFVTIFDADFIPEPDCLKRSIHYFTDPKVCVVQTRWDHLNRNDSLLTRTQAIFLDGHFAIEHVARNRSNRFMSFNGTAGTWRKCAIADSGGWQHDTLTEDLDLSYRAQLRGWKFVFLPELTAPAELPPEMGAFKAQQFRWTKGGAQVALKLLPKVMLSKAPIKAKLEAFFHLSCFSMHIYMTLLVLLIFPAIFLRSTPLHDQFWRTMFDISVFTLATMSASVFYVASQYELRGDWRMALKYMPMMMALGVGLCLNNTKAILEAVFGKTSEFVRTPKYGDAKALSPISPGAMPLKRKKLKLMPYLEMLMGLYMVACAICSAIDFGPPGQWQLSLSGKALGVAPFLVIFAFGFFYVSIMSLLSERVHSFAPAPIKIGA
jgi:cellulose synthase/poly-beta-1,6-N-acetylglucosamine synthase-like glycosyltransferase